MTTTHLLKSKLILFLLSFGMVGFGLFTFFPTKNVFAADGACGTANGTTLAAAPSGATLCSSGTASPVSGTGPWTWTCAGQGGGAADSPLCSANFLSGTNIYAACPFTPGNGQYVFNFPAPIPQYVLLENLANTATRTPPRQYRHERTYTFNALPGSYDIWAYTHDGYTTRSATLPSEQLHEQYYVDFFNGGSVVINPYSNCTSYPTTCSGWSPNYVNAKVQSGGTSLGTFGPTTDLVDGVNFADSLDQIGNDINLGGIAGSIISSLRVRHFESPAGAPGASSVKPTCVALRPALPISNCTGGLLTNGNFEDTTVSANIVGWTKGPTSNLGGNWIGDGARSAYINGGEQISQTIAASAGNTYTLNFFAGTHNPTRNETVALEFLNGSGVVILTQSVQIENDIDAGTFPFLAPYTITAGAPVGTIQVRVVAKNGGSAGVDLYVDTFCLTTTAVLVINGSCGASNNTCVSGNYVDVADTGTDYLWSCNSPNGGTNASCTLPKPVSGSCGTADGTTLATAPSGVSLCNAGTATAVSGTGPWTWTCVGQGGGADSPLCSANILSGTSIYSACPFTQGSGQYVFTFPQPFKALLNWGTNAPPRQPYHERTYTFNAMPGSYDIWAYTHDGYTTRAATLPAEQSHEQYFVDLFGGGSVVANPYRNCTLYPATCGSWSGDASTAMVQSGGTSLGTFGPTTDLTDGVNFAERIDQIGNDIHLGGSAGSTTASIRVRHRDAPAGSAAGASSVRPTCVALRPALPMMSCPANLLINGNFEDMTVTTNIPGWTKNPNTLNTYVAGEFIADGARAAFIAGTSQLYQWVPVTPGTTYQLTFSAGTHDPARVETVEIEFEDASGVDVGGHTVVNIDYDVDLVAYPNKLKAYSMTVTAPAGAARLRVLARNLAAPGPRYKIDAFCLTTITGPTGIVTVDPNPLDFGTLPVGGAPQSRVVTITNTGAVRVDGTILLPNVAPAGTYTCAAGDCSFGVNSGQSVQKTIILSATALGNLNASASLVGNIPPTPLALTATPDDKAKIELLSYVDGALIPTNNSSPHTLPPMGGASIAVAAAPVDYQFQVTNSGATPLGYTVDIPVGMAANYSCVGGGGNGCAGVGMPSGASKTFTIRFTPGGSGIGDKNGTITVTNTSANPGGGNIALIFSAHVINNQPVFQVLTTAAPQPTLIAGGYEVDFGDVYLGDSVTRVLNFYNDGDLPMDVSYGALGGPFVLSLGSANDIPPAGFHPVSIDFSPQVAGAVSVTMTVATDGYSGGIALVRLKGRGLTAPKLRVSVPTLTGGPNVYDFTDGASKVLDFGDWDIALSALTKTITIDNTLGSADATITDFSDPGVPFGGPTGATTILMGESRDFTFTFDPSVPGAVMANVNISSSDYGSPFTITLLGNGILTPPSITPDPINLGRVMVSGHKDIVVTLTSNDPLGRDFGIATLSLVDSAQFACIDPSPCEVTLLNGVPQNITLRFSPSSIGNKTTNLVFTSSDPLLNGFIIPVVGIGVRPSIRFEEK